MVAVRERPPQIIFVDLQLRDVPGREAIGWLRSNPALQSTPIIIIAGGNKGERIPPPPQPGAILRKPASPEAIRRTTRQVLGPSS